MALKQDLDALADNERPLRTADLMSLSDMSPEELGLLRDVWPDMDTGRRKDILGGLIELSEDNLDIDFNDLFRFCLGPDTFGWVFPQHGYQGSHQSAIITFP